MTALCGCAPGHPSHGAEGASDELRFAEIEDLESQLEQIAIESGSSYEALIAVRRRLADRRFRFAGSVTNGGSSFDVQLGSMPRLLVEGAQGWIDVKPDAQQLGPYSVITLVCHLAPAAIEAGRSALLAEQGSFTGRLIYIQEGTTTLFSTTRWLRLDLIDVVPTAP